MKRWSVLVLAILMIGILPIAYGLLSTGTPQVHPDHPDFPGPSADPLANPDSTSGQGQVDICGFAYHCRNDISDGICPEDFQDFGSTLAGSCSRDQSNIWYDLDCQTPITGTVEDTAGTRIADATVRVQVPGLVIETITDAAGTYTINAPYGPYFFSASKPGYDSDVEEVDVAVGTTWDAVLPSGTCHADCTDAYNRCNADCDGLEFSDGTCAFVSEEIKNACDNKLEGTIAYLGPGVTPDTSRYVECCTMNEYEEYNAVSQVSGDFESIIKYERIVRYNGRPVKLVVALGQK